MSDYKSPFGTQSPGGEKVLRRTPEEKKKIYEAVIPAITALIKDEADLIANLANVASVLKTEFGFFWVGFYLVKKSALGKNAELVLGPFQGTPACTRIPLGKGVCGTAWKEKKTILVPDVEKFPGHIACSSQSKSEIVVPLQGAIMDPRVGPEVWAVLDVDSDQLSDFDEVDAKYLEKLGEIISLGR